MLLSLLMVPKRTNGRSQVKPAEAAHDTRHMVYPPLVYQLEYKVWNNFPLEYHVGIWNISVTPRISGVHLAELEYHVFWNNSHYGYFSAGNRYPWNIMHAGYEMLAIILP